MNDEDLRSEAKGVLDAIYREMMGCEFNTTEGEDEKVKESPNPPIQRVSPVLRYVRSLGEDLMTVGEVAEELDVSESYIRKISDKRYTQAPSYLARFGKYKLRVYTQDDVEALRDYIEGNQGLEDNRDG